MVINNASIFWLVLVPMLFFFFFSNSGQLSTLNVNIGLKE